MGVRPNNKEVAMPDPNDKKATGTPTAPNPDRLLHSPGEVVVKHEDLPAPVPEEKKIHRRRPLPLVPDKSKEGSMDNT
jgi:hypothetical protein